MEDSISVRTPTRSELNTFKVMANLDFTDLKKPEPHAINISSMRRDSLDSLGSKDSEDSRKSDHSDRSRQSRGSRNSRHSQQSRQSQAKSQMSGKSRVSQVSQVSKHEQRLYDQGPERRSSVDSLDDHREEAEEPKPVQHEDDKFVKQAKEEAEIDIRLEKEALLYELELLEKQGQVKLHRQLTMSDSLESIQYQYDRANMIISTQQTVEWAKTGIKMGSGILETLVKKFGLTIVDGFSNNLCKDMNKFNKPLTKLYRKYWRRGTSSPESELAMIVLGALAMTIMTNKGFMGGFGGSASSNNNSTTTQPKSVVPAMMNPMVKDSQVQGPPSTMKGPNQGGPTINSMNSNPPTSAPTAKPLPEWARNALAQPSVPISHFAQQTGFPETRPVVPPMLPVSYNNVGSLTGNVNNVGTVTSNNVSNVSTNVSTNNVLSNPVSTVTPNEQPETKKIITLNSPKSIRRKRNEGLSELNLDV